MTPRYTNTVDELMDAVHRQATGPRYTTIGPCANNEHCVGFGHSRGCYRCLTCVANELLDRHGIDVVQTQPVPRVLLARDEHGRVRVQLSEHWGDKLPARYESKSFQELPDDIATQSDKTKTWNVAAACARFTHEQK
jgi:hypothetical protein